MFSLSPLPRKVAAALSDVSNPKVSVRLSALRDLVEHARTGDSQAAQALQRALSDADESVRAAAAVGLADADRSEAVDVLSEVARQDPSLRVRQMGLLALGELGSKNTPAVVAVLDQARRSSHAAERYQALLGLHQLGSDHTEDAILDALGDSDAEVRRLALRIARARWSGAEFPGSVRARIAGLLEDPEPVVSAGAAVALAEMGDRRGLPGVYSLIARRVPGASPEEEQAAMEVVGELGLVEAMALLRRRAFPVLARDPLAYDARVALARLGDARARDAIVRGLSAWTYDARMFAVAAAGRARLTEARDRLLAMLNHPEQADPAAVREALAHLDIEGRRA